MPCPHNEITIVQRSQRQSAVAAAAYQSGEKLFCEYDQQVKHYPEKRGIVHYEILLPPNAPQEYANITELDAATLNRLIKEIVVHERIDEDKTRHISIEIHFNLKPIPEVEQVTA